MFLHRACKGVLVEAVVSMAGATCGGKGHGLGPGNPQFKSGLYNKRKTLITPISQAALKIKYMYMMPNPIPALNSKGQLLLEAADV